MTRLLFDSDDQSKAKWLAWGKNKLQHLKQFLGDFTKFFYPEEGVTVRLRSLGGEDSVLVSTVSHRFVLDLLSGVFPGTNTYVDGVVKHPYVTWDIGMAEISNEKQQQLLSKSIADLISIGAGEAASVMMKQYFSNNSVVTNRFETFDGTYLTTSEYTFFSVDEILDIESFGVDVFVLCSLNPGAPDGDKYRVPVECLYALPYHYSHTVCCFKFSDFVPGARIKCSTDSGDGGGLSLVYVKFLDVDISVGCAPDGSFPSFQSSPFKIEYASTSGNDVYIYVYGSSGTSPLIPIQQVSFLDPRSVLGVPKDVYTTPLPVGAVVSGRDVTINQSCPGFGCVMYQCVTIESSSTVVEEYPYSTTSKNMDGYCKAIRVFLREGEIRIDYDAVQHAYRNWSGYYLYNIEDDSSVNWSSYDVASVAAKSLRYSGEFEAFRTITYGPDGKNDYAPQPSRRGKILAGGVVVTTTATEESIRINVEMDAVLVVTSEISIPPICEGSAETVVTVRFLASGEFPFTKQDIVLMPYYDGCVESVATSGTEVSRITANGGHLEEWSGEGQYISLWLTEIPEEHYPEFYVYSPLTELASILVAGKESAKLLIGDSTRLTLVSNAYDTFIDSVGGSNDIEWSEFHPGVIDGFYAWLQDLISRKDYSADEESLPAMESAIRYYASWKSEFIKRMMDFSELLSGVEGLSNKRSAISGFFSTEIYDLFEIHGNLELSKEELLFSARFLLGRVVLYNK